MFPAPGTLSPVDRLVWGVVGALLGIVIAESAWFLWRFVVVVPRDMFAGATAKVAGAEEAATALRAQLDEGARRARLLDLLNYAYFVGGSVKGGHDHGVQDRWALETQRLVVRAFGLGVSLRFISAHETEPLPNGAVLGPPRDWVIDSRLAYLRRLIDGVDRQPMEPTFNPADFADFYERFR